MNCPGSTCSKWNWRDYPPNEAVAEHTCPYAEEINDDAVSLCTCCDRCTQECSDDI